MNLQHIQGTETQSARERNWVAALFSTSVDSPFPGTAIIPRPKHEMLDFFLTLANWVGSDGFWFFLIQYPNPNTQIQT
uniref:Uncharacterized protein n=1 Tax=Rhizophora mucronata TaxID=61149 RepID=A0A2P2M680_RHIMU